jgi:hypothetical protein
VDADELRELLLSFENFPRILPDLLKLSIPSLKLLRCRGNFWNMQDPNTHFYRSKWGWPWAFELRWLLGIFSTSQCTILHDRVYALLGLVDGKTKSEYPILPDYDKPMLGLFMDVLKNASAGGEPDKWKELDSINLFRRVLCIGRIELAAYSAGFGSPSIEQNIFVLARGVEPIISLQFIDTVDIFTWVAFLTTPTRARKGVQLSLPPEVQDAIDELTAKSEERVDALNRLLEYR